MGGGKGSLESNIPFNILRASGLLGVAVLGHVPAASSAGGVDFAFEGWGLEIDGLEVFGGGAYIAFWGVSLLSLFIDSCC